MKRSPYTMHTISFMLMLMAFVAAIFSYRFYTVLLVVSAVTLGVLACVTAKRNLDAAQRSHHKLRNETQENDND